MLSPDNNILKYKISFHCCADEFQLHLRPDDLCLKRVSGENQKPEAKHFLQLSENGTFLFFWPMHKWPGFLCCHVIARTKPFVSFHDSGKVIRFHFI